MLSLLVGFCCGRNNASFKAFTLLNFFNWFCRLDFVPWVVKCSAACLLVLPNGFSRQLIFLFSFSLFTGICFYTHSPNREFLKLYFPHCQRGLLLKKPTVPPQSLTLVFSNTNRLQPTCSYSSIQRFSHQVRAWICYGMHLW